MPEAQRPWFVEIGSGSMKWRIPSDDVGGGESAMERHSCEIGLSAGLGADGGLSADSIARLDTALSDLGTSTAGRGLGFPVVVASEALRRAASDQSTVTDLVLRHLGAQLEILSGAEEGALALTAVRSQREPSDAPLTVVDVGAASTELVTGGGGSTDTVAEDHVSSFSMPLGGRSLAAQYLESDPPDPRELSAALSVVELHLDDVRREHSDLAHALTSGTVVGLGACVQIAAVEIGVDIADGPEPVAGYVLTHEAAEEIFRVLATESKADRLHNPGLLAHHVDGVVGALCIVVELFRQFAIDSLEISTVDVVDGLAVGHFPGDAKIGL